MNENIIGNKHYIRCMAPVENNSDVSCSPAVYRRSLLDSETDDVVVHFGSDVPKSEAEAAAFDNSRYLKRDTKITDNVIFYDGTGPHTRKLPFLEGCHMVYRYASPEDAERIRKYFSQNRY